MMSTMFPVEDAMTLLSEQSVESGGESMFVRSWQRRFELEVTIGKVAMLHMVTGIACLKLT